MGARRPAWQPRFLWRLAVQEEILAEPALADVPVLALEGVGDLRVVGIIGLRAQLEKS